MSKSSFNIEKKLAKLTPAYAERMLKCNDYAGQRAIKKDRKKELADKISQGRFHTGDISIAKINGTTVLMNGQHCCEAVVETGKSVDCVFQTFNCRNKEALAEVFAQFDNGNSRTAAHIALAYAVASGITDLDARGCMTAAAALAFLEVGKPNVSMYRHVFRREDRAKLIAAHPQEVKFIRNALFRVPNGSRPAMLRHAQKMPVAAAAISAFRKNRNLAHQFYRGVATGEGLKMRDIANKLRYLLQEQAKKSYQGKFGNSREQVFTFERCVAHWNAWRQGEGIPKRPNKIKEFPAAM